MPRNVAALLCYLLLFVTGILFLLIEPYSKDRFIRFHAFQAIFFFIALVVIQVVVNVLGLILVGVFPSPAGFVAQTLLQSSVMLGLLFLWILLMYKAYSHETFSLPVVGDLAARQA
ncbi:MAG: hypothetical protein HY315_07435 [Acidobacteria bacterium]|nr:hypothetical protein [Acidobacteriota bacterium]